MKSYLLAQVLSMTDCYLLYFNYGAIVCKKKLQHQTLFKSSVATCLQFQLNSHE